jgi:hypothetical protein
MNTTSIKVATVLAAIALLAGCTATTPGAAASTTASNDPTPAPTVTVTVTATPDPDEPVSDEMPDQPVMSSADAVEQCLEYAKTDNSESTPTGQPYTFLMHNGSWLVVVEGENMHGPLYISCAVGGDPAVAYGESSLDSLDPSWFDSIINGNGGL